MDLFEFQGKQLFAAAGIPVAESWLIHPHGPDPLEIANEVGLPLVAKVQVLSGGRGKAGGIRVVRTREEVSAAVAELMGLTVRGRRAVGVLLEEAVDIDRELYLAITIDRAARRPLLIFSTRGGMDIEEVAREEPQALFRAHIDPLDGLRDEQVRELAAQAGFDGAQATALIEVVWAVWRLFCAHEATLVEINPLVLARDHRFMALDAKVSVDDNALYRHREFGGFETDDDGREAQARREGMRYVELDGDIGVLGNGAGMVMSTLDLIAEAGGRAANFLDVGGGAREAQIAAALDLILSDERVRAVLVTIFGGITRCDEVARGLLAALESRGLAARGDEGAAMPVVVRLDGTSCDPARALVADARLANVVAEATAWDAVQRVVALAAAAPPPRTTPPATPASPTNAASPGDPRGRA